MKTKPTEDFERRCDAITRTVCTILVTAALVLLLVAAVYATP